MALEAGSVFVRLVGLFDKAEFDKWDKAVDSERAKSDKDISIKLAADTAGLEKDLSEARTKVSRWARTQDKFSLSYGKGDLDRNLADAKGRISAWGDKATNFKLGFAKGQLDKTLTEARTVISKWGDFENKFNIGFNKGHLEAQLVEARAMINAGLKDAKINVNIETAGALAKLAALRAASDAVVSGGGGGGGGGGGAAAAAAAASGGGGGGLERGLQNVIFRRGGPRIPGTRLTIPLGGFSAATILGLGPEHLVGAVGALGGSALSAGAGAGALALGALGQAAVGGGSDAAVVKSTIADTQTLSKAMDAVTQAEQRYGKGSNQAKQATFALNQEMANLGNTAGVKAEAGLAKAASTLNKQWDKATSNARVQAVAILKQGLSVGQTYVPLVAKAAADNLGIINKSLRPLFSWLKGPEGIQIFKDLEREFKQNLPVSIDALTNGIQLVARLMNIASRYTGGFTQAIDNHLKKWNELDNAYLNSKISKVIGDFKLWAGLLKDLGHDLSLLFKAGAGEGNDLVAMMDHGLKVFGAWEASAKGQSFLHTFFENRKVELEAVISLVGSALQLFGSFYAALQPLVPAVTMFVQSAAQGMGSLVRIISPVFQLLANILNIFVKLGEQNAVFKDAVIVPLGVALVSFRLLGAAGTKSLFDLSSHVAVLRRALVGMRAATAAIFAGEGVGSAWTKLKDSMKPTKADSPAASMEAGIISGSEKGAALVKEAIVTGHKEGAAAVKEAEATGGKVAGAEEAAGTAAGGATAAEEIAVAERLSVHPIFGTPLPGAANTAETLAEGAGVGASASRLSRLARGASRVGRGVAGNLPIIGAGYLGVSALSAASQRGDPLARIGGVAIAGATGGAVAGSVLGTPGVGTAIGGLIGGIGGGLSGAASLLFGGGESKAQKSLDSFTKKIKDIKDPAQLSASQIKSLQTQATNLAKEIPKAEGPLNTLWHRLNALPTAVNARRWKSGFDEAWSAVHDFAVRGGDSIKNIKDRFDTNMRLISYRLGLESKAGAKLANANFDQMVEHLSAAMRRGDVNVTKAVDDMRNAADNGTQQMRDDLAGHFNDILKNIRKSWKDGNTSTQDALTASRHIYKSENDIIRKDIQAHYQALQDDAQKSYDHGELTTAQYAAKRTSIHKQMAHDIAAAEVKLSTSSGKIIDGLNTATAAGMDELFRELNKGLDALNVKQVKWGVSKVSNVVSKSLGNISGAIPFVGGASSGGPNRGGTFASGGMLPGAEFGMGDQMTLVDPTGRPRAKMAGNELIFTQHQAPFVEAGLQMLGFGGADDLWSKIDRPHGYERGGRLLTFQKGGKNSATPNFAANFDGKPANVTPAVREIIGLMEHRFPNLVVTATRNGGHANGSLHYIGEAVDMAADPNTMINAANYVMMSGLYKNLLEGIHNPNLSIKNGRRVSPGFWGSSTWANHTSHLHLAASSLAGGLAATGGGAQGGIGSWNSIKAPTISGPGGPLQQLAQGVINKTAKAANVYGSKQAGSFDFTGIGGGGSNTQNEALGLKMMLAAGWGANQWPFLKALWTQESGWSSTAVNPSSGAYGIPQSLGHGHPYNLGDAKAQIAWGLRYIKQRYGSPMAAEAHERQFNWYNLGGMLPGFASGGQLGRRLTLNRQRRTKVTPPHAAHPKTATRPKTAKTQRPQSLAGFVGQVAGIKEFSADDAKIAALEDKYNRQEQIFQLYDSQATTTGNLPVADLDVLAGIRKDEWVLLQGEYRQLPHILNNLHHDLEGRPAPKHQTKQQKRKQKAAAHRRGQEAHRESGQYGGAQVVVPAPGEGINKLVSQYESAINRDETMVIHLRDDLRKATLDHSLAGYKVSKKSIDLAESIAKQQATLQDGIISNLTAASLITDQIESLPVTQNATPLGGLHGSAYAQAQAHNIGLAKTNATIREHRQVLYRRRNHILGGNIDIRKKLEHLANEKGAAERRLATERFDIAWKFAVKKYGIEERIFKIEQMIKLLKQKLAKEKALQKKYQDAYDAVHTRLYGGDASEPNATDIQQQMGDIGFDILSLVQEGADNVPANMVSNIKTLLTKLGVKLPAGAGGPGASTATAGQAFDDFLAFQASRANLFAQFGSNFVSAGANPFAGAAGIAAGTQYYGAAAGPSGGGAPAPGGMPFGPSGPPSIPGGAVGAAAGGAPVTNVNITQNFGSGPPDAHSYAAGLNHELGALV